MVAARLGLIHPADFADPDELVRKSRSRAIVSVVEELKPAHFPYLYPEVFLGSRAGFDVIVGNPPWDKVRWEAAPYWSKVRPGLMGMKDRARDKEIERLRAEHPTEASHEAQQQADRERLQEYFKKGSYSGAARISTWHNSCWSEH